jgi:hypothetical protein
MWLMKVIICYWQYLNVIKTALYTPLLMCSCLVRISKFFRNFQFILISCIQFPYTAYSWKHYLISYTGQKQKVSDRLFLKILTKKHVIPSVRYEIYPHGFVRIHKREWKYQARILICGSLCRLKLFSSSRNILLWNRDVIICTKNTRRRPIANQLHTV